MKSLPPLPGGGFTAAHSSANSKPCSFEFFFWKSFILSNISKASCSSHCYLDLHIFIYMYNIVYTPCLFRCLFLTRCIFWQKFENRLSKQAQRVYTSYLFFRFLSKMKLYQNKAHIIINKLLRSVPYIGLIRIHSFWHRSNHNPFFQYLDWRRSHIYNIFLLEILENPRES